MPRWLLSLLIYTAYGLGAIVLFLFAWSSTGETVRLNREVSRIKAEIAQLKTEYAARRNLSDALSSDPFYVERVLRERYGCSLPNEERVDITPTGPARQAVASVPQPAAPQPGVRTVAAPAAPQARAAQPAAPSQAPTTRPASPSGQTRVASSPRSTSTPRSTARPTTTTRRTTSGRSTSRSTH